MSDSKLILTPYQIFLLSQALSFYLEQFNHFLFECDLESFDQRPFSYDNIVDLLDYFNHFDEINHNDRAGETFLEVSPSYLSHRN